MLTIKFATKELTEARKMSNLQCGDYCLNMPTSWSLLFTCEHARNAIPARYRDVAERAGSELETHRGYDPGTLELGRDLARRYRSPLIDARYSRLLVELNRSPWHPRLWSEFSRDLPSEEKRALLEEYYFPHRESVMEKIREVLADDGKLLHVAVHSFTPVLQGETRNAEVGFLYDPSRPLEKSVCARWREELRRIAPEWRVRMNYPYRGVADGLTPHLRKHFSEDRYAGVELEVNQRLVLESPAVWKTARKRLVESLAWCQY